MVCVVGDFIVKYYIPRDECKEKVTAERFIAAK
jgi:hypothetical protein